MAGNQLAITLTVGADGLVEGLKLAGKSVDGAAQQMRQSFGHSAEAASNFTGVLREFKTEATQASRVANFYARDLAEIIPHAEGAASSLRGLTSALFAGSAIGAGIELVIFALRAVNEELKEEEKRTIEVRNTHIETAGQIREALKSIEEGFEKNVTKVRRFKEEFAKGSREQGDAAKKAALTAIDESGGVLEFAKYMWQVIKEGPEHAKPAIFKAVDDAYQGVLERAREFEASRAKIGSASGAEKRSRDETFYLQLEQEKIKETEKLEQDIFQRALKRLNDEIAQNRRKDVAIGTAREARQRIEEQNARNREERAKRVSEVEAEQAKKAIREWGAAAQQIGAAAGQAFAGIVTGTMTVKAAFKSMGVAIVRAVTSAAIKALEAYAVSAAGAAFFSQAGIPVIGPILAVAAAATAGAFIEGLISSLPSAAVGMPLVPRDMPVFVHEGERILTKQENQAYGQGAGGAVHLHFPNALFVDRRGLEQLAQEPHFIRGLNESRRNGQIA